MSALKETADAGLSSTGPQAALAAEVVSAGLTLNTKPLFKLMVEKKASDLFFTSNAPIKIKIEGQILAVNKQVLTPEAVKQTAYALMSNEQREYFQPRIRDRFRDLRAGPRTLPRQRLHAAWLSRNGAALYHG